MHHEYGESIINTCGDCCNCQKADRNKPDLICIAYGSSATWNKNFKACEKMFNYPFRALRPRVKALDERSASKRDMSKEIDNQISLF